MGIFVLLAGLIGLAFTLLFYASVIYCILWALGGFGIIDSKNKLFQVCVLWFERVLGPFLRIVRSFAPKDSKVDLGPLFLVIALIVIPYLFVLIFGSLGLLALSPRL